MDSTSKPADDLTATDVMNRDVVKVPIQMPVRQAACLIHRAGVSEAAVVDEQEHCVGMLSPEDILRWIEAGCPEAVANPAASRPYQVRGRLLTGEQAIICVLALGSCPFQRLYSDLGGRHTNVCMRPGTADSPFGTMPRYMTTDIVTVRPETPLPEVIRQVVDAWADRLFVLDECERPIGIVSATHVLSIIARDAGADHS